uniref:Putative conserved secreted protein n=1 Tax=Anopheles triannulatus TaxID=58253 RepID=A0A2M4A7N8_9DIPT
MSKLSDTLLFIGLSLLVICDGSPMSSESSESNEYEETGILKEIRKHCKSNTRSNVAFSEVMESADVTFMCIWNFDAENFVNDFNQLTNATRGTFFTKYCPKVRSLISCYGDMFAAVRPCLKEGKRNMVQALFDSIPETLDLACKNDGEIIFKLTDQKRQECFKLKADQMSACANTLKNNLNGDWEDSKLTPEQCSILTNTRQCLKDQLDACDLSDIIGIYDIPINAILPLTPCANYTQEPTVHLLDNNTIIEN